MLTMLRGSALTLLLTATVIELAPARAAGCAALSNEVCGYTNQAPDASIRTCNDYETEVWVCRIVKAASEARATDDPMRAAACRRALQRMVPEFARRFPDRDMSWVAQRRC